MRKTLFSALIGIVALAGVAAAVSETMIYDSIRWRGSTQAKVLTWDADNNRLTAADDVSIRHGTDGDVATKFDGTSLLTEPAATNTPWKIGATAFGMRPQLLGPSRPIAFNSLSTRYELRWVAGSRGKPSINADINSATEATREIADPDFEVLGTNGSSDDCTFYVEGGVKLETDGAADDQVIVLPHLDANQSAWAQVTWGSDKEAEWEADIASGSAITDTIIWAGLKLTNTQVTATDNDQVFFRYEADVNDGEWQGVSSIGGTDTETDLNVVVAVSTRYHLKITIDSSRIARFYMNGALVKTTAALADTKDFIPYIGIENDGGAGAAKHMYIFGQTISRVIG